MRNSIKTFGKLTIPLHLLLAICFSALPAQAKYGGGKGEPNDPYLIYNANQMNAIGADANDWDKHFLLMADIDLSGYTGTSFNIIGTDWNYLFTGVFDGSGHAISNFTYDSNGVNYIGLFGYVRDPNAEIKNLGLIDPNVDAGTGSNVGSMIGHLSGGTVTGCYAEGGSVSGGYNVGGLVGDNEMGTITNCYSVGSVSGDWYVGGLAGDNYAGRITNCHAIVEVSGRYYVAGLVGNNYWGSITNCRATASVSGIQVVGGLVGSTHHGTIVDSYSTGSVSGYEYVGGLLGYNHPGTIWKCYSEVSVSGVECVGGLVSSNRGIITNCYAKAGSVAGDRLVGGLVGLNRGTIINCFATSNVSGMTDVGGLVGYGGGAVYNSFWDIETSGQTSSDGGTGLPTADMQMESTFTDVGWDFVGETINGSEDIWRLCVDGIGYPELNWQFLLGDFLCPDRVDFIDYSFFASHWLEDNCGASNDCEGTDLDQLGTVDANDLAILVGNWLAAPPPGQAGNPNPADGATGIVMDANLSWSPGYWAALHEVYFGTDPCALPLVATQPRGQESYDPPGDLIRGTTYYWCVDEVSTYGTITGTVWSFTTIPGKAHTPSPADGAVIPGEEIEYPPDSGNWYIYTQLDFVPGPTADPDPNVRRAYFSNNRDDVVNRVQDANLGPPPYMDPCCYQPNPDSYFVGLPASVYEMDPYAFVPETGLESLERGEVYYWCVDEADAYGHTFPGDIWQFSIQGYRAFSPDPLDGAVLVNTDVLLTWEPGIRVSDHDIYMGTDWDDVNDAVYDFEVKPPEFVATVSLPSYQCADLPPETTLYWRIDEIYLRFSPSVPGESYKGNVWEFTTGAAIPGLTGE